MTAILTRRRRFSTGQLALDLILLLLSLSMILPFLYILSVSFTDATAYKPQTVILWPTKWSVNAYRLVLSGSGFFNSIKSTLFITCIGTPLQVAVNAGMAYMLSCKNLPGKGIMMKLVVFTMLFFPGMIPGYLVIRNLGLINSLWALILPSSAGAWTLIVMKSFFQSIPAELQEAATIDGCNEMQIFFRIMLPLSKAMLATFTLFATVGYWNIFFNAIIYITDSTKWPLQVFLQQMITSSGLSEFVDVAMQDNFSQNIPTEIIKMSTIIISVVPIMCVYPFLQKYFAKGVMIGSVKG